MSNFFDDIEPKKCFFVNENFKCPHCKKKVGEEALKKADTEFWEQKDREAEEKEEQYCETKPVKKRLKHSKELFGK